MFDLNKKVTAQMLREREIAIHGSKQYVIDTIMKMRNQCSYDDFCFLGWFELGGFAAKEIDADLRRGGDAGARARMRRQSGAAGPWAQPGCLSRA
jgi:hypothetical protein